MDNWLTTPLYLGALRTEGGLRCSAIYTEQHGKDGRCKKHTWRMHGLA